MVLRITSSLLIAAAASFGTVAAAKAEAVNKCMPRSEMLKQLSSLYKEAPVAVGVGDNGAVLEVLASHDGATWTAVVTRTNGVSCVVMSGDSWQISPPQTLARYF